MTVIDVRQFHKRYRDHVAVRDISFTVERGEIFGIVGPNGAGKTTTVECIAGLRAPDGGTIRVLGLDPQRDRDELRRHVGIQLQSCQLPDKIKVWEALDLYRSFYDDPADSEQLLHHLGLAEKRRATFDKLSGGQRQRLSIGLALIGNPQIAILDELTAGLDPQARRETWQLIEAIRARGVTIILVTHFMEEAEHLCDRLAVIDRGTVVALDSPRNLVVQADAEQRLRFRPSTPLDEGLLRALPEVRRVEWQRDQLVITGHGELLQAVMALLARDGIVARDLRIEQGDLGDAFVALTRRTGEHTPAAV